MKMTSWLGCWSGVLVATMAMAEVRTLNSGNLVLDGVPELSPQLAVELARYQNVRSAAFRDWTADGQSLYVSTRFADLAQIHRVDMPGGARHQITFFKESPGAWNRSPTSDMVIFSMDQGGSEFSQLFRFDPATGNSVMLTDGKSRYGAVVWSADGQRIAYSSNERDGASNDVWVMDPHDPSTAHLVWTAPDGTWWGPSEFSADGSTLMVQNYTSANQSAFLSLELATGKHAWLAGGPGEVGQNLFGGFATGGTGMFYVAAKGSDFAQLYHRAQLADPATDRLVTADIPWDLSSFVLSADKSRGAFVVNEDGIERVYLLDPKTLAYTRAEQVPVGRIGGMDFSPNGRRLAVTVNTAKSPSDTFVLELGDRPTAALELVRWTFSEVGGLNTENFAEPRLVHYPTFDEVDGAPRKIPAFVYEPAGSGPHPVIISIHGGPEAQSQPGFSSTYQLWMERLGAVVIEPNVRGSVGYGSEYQLLDNGFKREDSVKDIGALLDWIATQPHLDASRVAVIGGSYGGYMVLASAVHYSDRLKAAVDIVGISNFVTFLENTEDYRRDLRRVEYGDERDPEMRAFLQRISPLNNVSKIQVPLMVVQGQNDPRVPVTEAEQIVAAVRAEGKTVWYINALNEGHGYRRKENRDVYDQAVIAFFEQNLLGGAPAAQ